MCRLSLTNKKVRDVARGLAQEWGLTLPSGINELGVLLDYSSKEDDWSLNSERWFFGQVL